MAVVARYVWQGKRWAGRPAARHPRPIPPTEDTPFSIERDRTTSSWDILEHNGTLLCRCVNRQSAERMVKYFRGREYAVLRHRKSAALVQTKRGWVHQTCIGYDKAGDVYYLRSPYFATREAAETDLLGEC